MAQKPMLRFSFIWLTALFAASCTVVLPQQYYNDGVSDDEYIRIARETGEAQAFLDHYPAADVYVDRSSKLAVDFRFNQVLPAATDQSWEGIRLRVFIDPQNKRAAGAFVDCKDKSGEQNFVEEDLIEYLEQYAQKQTCP